MRLWGDVFSHAVDTLLSLWWSWSIYQFTTFFQNELSQQFWQIILVVVWTVQGHCVRRCVVSWQQLEQRIQAVSHMSWVTLETQRWQVFLHRIPTLLLLDLQNSVRRRFVTRQQVVSSGRVYGELQLSSSFPLCVSVIHVFTGGLSDGWLRRKSLVPHCITFLSLEDYLESLRNLHYLYWGPGGMYSKAKGARGLFSIF